MLPADSCEHVTKALFPKHVHYILHSSVGSNSTAEIRSAHMIGIKILKTAFSYVQKLLQNNYDQIPRFQHVFVKAPKLSLIKHRSHHRLHLLQLMNMKTVSLVFFFNY